MIAYLRGVIVDKGPTRLVLDCSGTGFEVGVPLSTSSRVGDMGSQVGLLVVTRFAQTGVELYGFLDRKERDVFEMLLSVKGIGPKAGLNFLSRFNPEEILQTIASGRIEVVKTVPGIGPKKAERVLSELAEKTAPAETGDQLMADAESALVSLGLTRREARTRLQKVRAGTEMTLEALLKQSLRTEGV